MRGKTCVSIFRCKEKILLVLNLKHRNISFLLLIKIHCTSKMLECFLQVLVPMYPLT